MNVIINSDKLDALAMGVYRVTGEEPPLTLDEMKDALQNAEIGGGGITPTGNINITQAGQTDVTNYATATVASGTEGTPTAAKGSVSNHSVSVTPSVTNAEGYITGGTKTGTAVTVQASELVSGTLTVDSSGTKDVTNYASASVPAGTAGTPSASKGAVSNHSVTVTPSVTNQTGWISGSTKTGTAVTVTAAELVSGSQTVTQNGAVDCTNLAEIVVAVEGGGGGMTVAAATATPSTASSSIQFTGLSGEPTSFVVISAADLATGASPYKTAAVVFDGTDLHGQIVTNTSNANASYSTSFTKAYSNGTLTITGSGTNFQPNQYKLIYTYGGTSANLGTAETQVGSGATSVTFTGLTDEPDYFSVIFKSNFGTSSGYQRVISVVYDGTNTYGLAMDSGAKALSSWSYTYSNGTLTVSSVGTNNGGYFHQPGYYQLTYGVGGTVEPVEIEVEPLSVTTNGTYTAPEGKAYSPVTVNVASGSSKNVQVVQSTSRTTATSLSKVSGEITVSKTGTYDIYWSACRTNTSSSYTWGTRMYIGNTAYGTENTTWSNNTQNNHLSNVSLTANDVISVYARGRGGNYYAMVPMLLIIES